MAQADEGEVTGAWAGLGYYARARNLLKCAKIISSDYGGKFPSDYKTLLKLPGIGPYTAGAIASIAFDKKEVVVDGNVERVISRLFDIKIALSAQKESIIFLSAIFFDIEFKLFVTRRSTDMFLKSLK